MQTEEIKSFIINNIVDHDCSFLETMARGWGDMPEYIKSDIRIVGWYASRIAVTDFDNIDVLDYWAGWLQSVYDEWRKLDKAKNTLRHLKTNDG
jgi:hypothetical protein